MGIILSITGHRPDKFDDDYEGEYPVAVSVRMWLGDHFTFYNPDKVIWGCAQGVDTWAAEEAIELGIPIHAAIPFEGFDKSWSYDARRKLENLLKKCSDVTIVSVGSYRAWYFQVRNEWMVDHSDKLLAVWNGTAGGTWNCIQYARKIEHPIDYITEASASGFPIDPAGISAPPKRLLGR